MSLIHEQNKNLANVQLPDVGVSTQVEADVETVRSDNTAANRSALVANTATSELPLTQATAPAIGSKPFLYTGQTPHNTGDGVEIVTNSTFDTDTTGWTGYNSVNISVVDGQLQLRSNGSLYGYASQAITVVANTDYVLVV